MRGRLPLTRDDDAYVGDGQGGVRLALGCSTVGDVDALGGVTTDVGWATGGCGLDEVAALLQTLLPLIQHTAGGSKDAKLSRAYRHINMQLLLHSL